MEPVALELISGAAVSVVRGFLDRRNSAADSEGEVDLPESVLVELRDQVEELGVSREAIASGKSAHGPTGSTATGAKTLSTTVGGAALSIAPSEIFQDARARNGRVFVVNLVLGIALASLLFVTIAGVLVSSLVLHETAATVSFAGVSVLDLFGLAFTKPFKVIQQASVTSQRLDLAHLRLQEQLRDCDLNPDPAERFACRSQVWDTIQAELRSLGED